MNVYGIQFDIAWEDRSANFATVRRLLGAARPATGALLVLPEMFASGFSMNAPAIAEAEEGGETFRFLAATAREWRAHVLGGLATRDERGVFRNEAVLFGPDGSAVREARYAKMYPFAPGGEADHYAAGDTPVVADVGGFRLAPRICYDLRFPEAFRPPASPAPAPEVIVVIASWPEARIGHWDALLAARAIENQAYVVGVNRCGADPFLRYPGHSRIVGPDGALLAEAGDGEAVISAALDRAALHEYRQRLPFLADRKPAPTPALPAGSARVQG